MFTKCPMKLASNGFEQNLQRHNESVRCSWFDFISVMELSSLFKLIDRTSLYSSNQKFGWKAFSSRFTFGWSFRQNEAFVAVRTLHGREISSKLCDICASWAPGIQSVWRLLSISLRFTCTWSTIPPQCSVSSWSAPSSARHSGWRSPPPPLFSSAPLAPPRSPRGLLGREVLT